MTLGVNSGAGSAHAQYRVEALRCHNLAGLCYIPQPYRSVFTTRVDGLTYANYTRFSNGCFMSIQSTSSWKSAQGWDPAEMTLKDVSDEAESSTRDDEKNRIDFELRRYENRQISLPNG